MYKRHGVLSQLLDLSKPKSSPERVIYDKERDQGQGLWISYVDDQCVAVQKNGGESELVYGIKYPRTKTVIDTQGKGRDQESHQQPRMPPLLPRNPMTVYNEDRLLKIVDCAEPPESPRRLVYDASRDRGKHFMVTYCDGKCLFVMNTVGDIIYQSERYVEI